MEILKSDNGSLFDSFGLGSIAVAPLLFIFSRLNGVTDLPGVAESIPTTILVAFSFSIIFLLHAIGLAFIQLGESLVTSKFLSTVDRADLLIDISSLDALLLVEDIKMEFRAIRFVQGIWGICAFYVALIIYMAVSSKAVLPILKEHWGMFALLFVLACAAALSIKIKCLKIKYLTSKGKAHTEIDSQ